MYPLTVADTDFRVARQQKLIAAKVLFQAIDADDFTYSQASRDYDLKRAICAAAYRRLEKAKAEIIH